MNTESTAQPDPIQPQNHIDPEVCEKELDRDRARAPLDQLLRRPEVLLERLDGPGAGRTLALLSVTLIAGFAAYGLVLASFSGGAQWWAAPTKLALGTLLAGALCFPSLFLFLILAGGEVRMRHVLGVWLGLCASTAIFLAGFGPVAWIFTQSSTLLAPLAVIHFVLWIGSLVGSQRVLRAGIRLWGARRGAWVGAWFVIFVLTSLQMSTTLRPLLGSADRFFDPTRKFFLVHWAESVDADVRARKE